MTISRDQELRMEIAENQAESLVSRRRSMSRRMVLRRSALGVTGVGLTALLAACGGGEGDDDEEDDEEEDGD